MNNSTSTLWSGFRYPPKWGKNKIFMCRHFNPQSVSDEILWKSQLQFWNEAIANYAQQLLNNCPFPEKKKLAFTILDIEQIHTLQSKDPTINGLKPMCIPEIIHHFLSKNKKTPEIKILTIESLMNHSYNQSIQIPNAVHIQPANTSYFSSIFHSVSNYFSSESEITDKNIGQNTELIWIPSLHSICMEIENIACNHLFNYFGSKVNAIQNINGQNINIEELKEIINIGIIQTEKNSISNEYEIIINGYVFNEYCVKILNLTSADILIIKHFLQQQKRMNIYYTNEQISENISNNSALDCNSSKNEFLKFKTKNQEKVLPITEKDIQSMQLISIQLTIKYLENEQKIKEVKLQEITLQLLEIRKEMKDEKRNSLENTLQKQLLTKRKLYKNRIKKIMILRENLENVVCNIQDQKFNKIVFQSLKNANHILHGTNNVLNVETIEDLFEDINENIVANEEISVMLAQPLMDDDMDVEEEFNELLEENIDEHLVLPLVPNHNIVVHEEKNDENKESEEELVLFLVD